VDTDIEQLAARLGHLEDLEAIRATWLQYCNRLDLEDFEALADVFTENAVLEVDGLSPGLDGRYHQRRSIIDDFYAATGTSDSSEATAGFMTGHLSTNMQIDLDGDEATTLAYFFEIVDNDLVLIGTYQHRLRRDPDRWRIAFLRISVRYRARLETGRVRGQPLTGIVAKPV
jgi:CHAD domain-containing protein